MEIFIAILLWALVAFVGIPILAFLFLGVLYLWVEAFTVIKSFTTYRRN